VKGQGRNPNHARGERPLRAPRHALGTLVRRAALAAPVARASGGGAIVDSGAAAFRVGAARRNVDSPTAA
jgi:hypothetical protein